LYFVFIAKECLAMNSSYFQAFMSIIAFTEELLIIVESSEDSA
jgi:hypothetical protein